MIGIAVGLVYSESVQAVEYAAPTRGDIASELFDGVDCC
jgi:hypothetical protein